MRLSDFDYNLPQELIAQELASPRDSCRLLVLNRESGEISHRHFFEIGDYLRAGDLLVLNNTRVFKARLLGELDAASAPHLRGYGEPKGKKPPQPMNGCGGKVEIFLVRPDFLPHIKGEREGVGEADSQNPSTPPLEQGRKVGCWLALGKPGRRLKVGETVKFADDFACKILSKNDAGELTVDFGLPVARVIELANLYGHIPTPPYIKKEPAKTEEYQTVYAAKTGSVAAPTAGFHFTEELIKKLKERGIEFVEITLHVGLGTFLPIRADEISEHKMHAEWVEISAEAAEKINAAKLSARRVIAVGTTTTRALEGVFVHQNHSNIPRNVGMPAGLIGYSGFVNIFIQPGFEFKVIEGLITNFHLPKSTLLVLVSALAGSPRRGGGRENILRAYQEAVVQKYRFYSFGDAMMII